MLFTLILTLITGNGVAITQVPNLSHTDCELAKTAWLSKNQSSSYTTVINTSAICVKTGDT